MNVRSGRARLEARRVCAYREAVTHAERALELSGHSDRGLAISQQMGDQAREVADRPMEAARRPDDARLHASFLGRLVFGELQEVVP